MSNSNVISRVNQSRNQVWEVGTQSWVAMLQPVISTDTLNVSLSGVATSAKQDVGNTSLASIDGSLAPSLLFLSGSSSSSGNNLILTPTSGKRLHIYYSAYNNTGGAVEVAFRFGVAGNLWLRNNLANTGSIVAKEFGTKFLSGALNEALYLNLTSATATIWNVFYSEV